SGGMFGRWWGESKLGQNTGAAGLLRKKNAALARLPRPRRPGPSCGLATPSAVTSPCGVRAPKAIEELAGHRRQRLVNCFFKLHSPNNFIVGGGFFARVRRCCREAWP